MSDAHPPVSGERIFRSITADELSKHVSPTDCWVAVYGKVLDVSGFLKSHPGGAKVLAKEAGTTCPARLRLWISCTYACTRA
jgi:cytochrome b involved in lipid metabolism